MKFTVDMDHHVIIVDGVRISARFLETLTTSTPPGVCLRFQREGDEMVVTQTREAEFEVSVST